MTPERLCRRCQRFFDASADRHIPCRHRGCKHTWDYTRETQLRDWLQGRELKPDSRLCDTCTEKIRATADRAMPCMVPGCGNTWIYGAEDQVRDQCLGRREPTPKRCAECEQFLAATSPKDIPCPHCGKPIHWSCYEQLLCKLGTFAQPSMCPDCAEQELAMDRPEENIEKTHHLIVRMPATGRWQGEERIRDWPPHLTYDVIARAEKADVRIVALGDDLTWSAETADQAWPFLLEKTLNDTLADRCRVAVINAGIPRSTSRQALLRLSRDVFPFRPHLTIFSFILADSFLWLNRNEKRWHENVAQDEAVKSMETLFERLTSTRSRLLFWNPNPVYPQDHVDTENVHEYRAWAKAQLEARDFCLRQARQLCKTHNVPMFDAGSLFEVNGTRSARRWMADWYSHNAAGAQNIATWLAAHLVSHNLLPLPPRAPAAGTDGRQ